MSVTPFQQAGPQLRTRAEGLASVLPPLLADAEHLATTVMLGSHGRRRAGSGDEFWQYRPFTATDEARTIDWRRSGRSDVHFVREKEWQGAQSVTIWVDGSQSMAFTGDGNRPSKADRARLLALAMSVLLVRAGERVGLSNLGQPPRGGQLQLVRLAEALTGDLGAGDTEADYGMPQTPGLPQHARALFVSDFLGDMDAVEAALGKAADRGVRGAILQVLDPVEETFPFDGRTIFESMGGTLRHETLKAGELKGAYLERLAARKDRLEHLARVSGWLYSCHHTGDSAQAALLWLYAALGAVPLMFTIGALGFTAPLLLLGLIALPILWIILRAVPPAPIRRRFPGVALLLGLTDDETQTDRTPWWLLLLRMLAAAAVILAFAGPVLNPQTDRAGTGPVLILVDATWADARDWPRRLDRIEGLLADAARADRPVALVAATDLPAGDLPFRAPAAWESRLPGFAPQPWAPDPEALAEWAGALEGGFETWWLSDGVGRENRDATLDALEAQGAVTVFESPRALFGLRPATFEDGRVKVTALRARADGPREATISAMGLDPTGTERRLARATAVFESGDGATVVELVLPPELRNRITRFEIDGARSAGAVSLTDDSLRRREVALLAGRDDREGLELLSPLHYLQQALEPTADLIEGALADVLLANPDAIVFADIATVSPAEEEGLIEWVEGGGLLVRFAGPRVASSDVSRATLDPLMPVRLRQGGRSVGGAMSWGEPKELAPFDDESPFDGLAVPPDVTVQAQVVAQPDPELAGRSIAALADGTPLVTRRAIGEGQVILFHVTANAEWSSLPLSGLFVQMLERLAISTRPAQPDAEDLAGTVWQPTAVLDAFGNVQPSGTLPGVDGARIAAGGLGPDMPPGLYEGNDRSIAVNVLGTDASLAPAAWPARIPVEGLDVARETALKGFVLAAALALLAADIVASLFLSGRLGGLARGAASVMALAFVLGAPPETARAQTSAGEAARAQDQASVESFALEVTTEVVLAHVITGDDAIDQVALAGLRGLSDTLFRRTSIEPAAPIGVNLETDELAFFPFLYWPVTTEQPIPSDVAYSKLTQYLRTGGMILFDTRDADLGGFGAQTPEGRKLQQLARPLDVPPLEPVPQDHVLTRTFYLLQDFPGRHASRDVWVEAAPPDAEQVEGMPFRNLNDNVTPVVIGGNDWATAWATGPNGQALFPVGRGYAGERQREIAYRFGVNLIMHVLTGNYKSDQVHVPALLERLGQ